MAREPDAESKPYANSPEGAGVDTEKLAEDESDIDDFDDGEGESRTVVMPVDDRYANDPVGSSTRPVVHNYYDNEDDEGESGEDAWQLTGR